MKSIPLSTLTLRALQAQRQAYPGVYSSARPSWHSSGSLPKLDPAIAALHGLPPADQPFVVDLPPLARAASRALRDLPLSVGPGRWALPSTLPPKHALRLASALALRLPDSLAHSSSAPELLEEVLRQLERNLTAHPKTDGKTWPTLQALAPAITQCLQALVGGSHTLGGPGFPQPEREACAVALVTRTLRLLANYSAEQGEEAGSSSASNAQSRLALARQLCSALPPSAAAQCAPALQALSTRLGL